MTKPIVLTYPLKQTLPSQSVLHSKWGWNKARNYYRREFINLLTESTVPKVKAFELEVRYHTGHDCDNIAPFAKFFVDVFRELEHVKNDTKDMYKSLKIIPDTTLPKKTLQFTIIPCKK